MCWQWQRAKNPNGYGAIRLKGRNFAAHRIAKFIASGTWPDVVRHSCDVRACCNPSHLLEGTQLDNVRDKMQRSRGVRGEELPHAKLTAAKVLEIRSDPRGARKLARAYGVSVSLIGQVRTRKIWREIA